MQGGVSSSFPRVTHQLGFVGCSLSSASEAAFSVVFTSSGNHGAALPFCWLVELCVPLVLRQFGLSGSKWVFRQRLVHRVQTGNWIQRPPESRREPSQAVTDITQPVLTITGCMWRNVEHMTGTSLLQLSV